MRLITQDQITLLREADWDLISSYAGLLILATGSVWAGAFGSLPKPPRKKGEKSSNEDEEEEEDEERITSEDAWLFPIFGSLALCSLYLVVRHLGTEWINWLLGIYLSMGGIATVPKLIIALAKKLLGQARWEQFDRIMFSIHKGSKKIKSVSLRTPSLFLTPLGAVPSLLYTFWPTGRKSVFLADILALALCHTALGIIKLDSFYTGCVLLSGLFLYDVWWVFGTEVMVKVATSLDVPIKLLWPKSVVFSSGRGHTMLGLGDVVIPGLFVALCLRYDHHRSRSDSSDSHGGFRKPYFTASLVAYVVGLGTCMAVMHTFRMAQPALLYLSPASILSFLVVALTRGELKEAWSWKDGPVDTPSEVDRSCGPN